MAEKPKLAISFSGGRSSALMLVLCLQKYDATHDIQITFANTGCEENETLDFVDEVDRKITGNRIVWIEAEIDPLPGVGIRHRVVDYLTASRDGRPFREYIAKYGIPNRTNPACTSRLKTEPMESYLASIGFVRGVGLNYTTAIGIRADEWDRASRHAAQHRLIYPLIDAGVTTGQVIEFWKRQPFDLRLKGTHYGNCTWCWKKSLRKLMTLAKEAPRVYDFPREMERLFGTYKADAAAGHNGRRYFFEGHRSVDDIFAMASKPFRPFIDARQTTLFDDFDPELDAGGGCGDSCEIGADEMGELYDPTVGPPAEVV